MNEKTQTRTRRNSSIPSIGATPLVVQPNHCRSFPTATAPAPDSSRSLSVSPLLPNPTPELPPSPRRRSLRPSHRRRFLPAAQKVTGTTAADLKKDSPAPSSDLQKKQPKSQRLQNQAPSKPHASSHASPRANAFPPHAYAPYTPSAPSPARRTERTHLASCLDER